MKNVKWSAIIIAACYIAAGSLFFADPSITREYICNWIGYGLIIIGVVNIIYYFIRPKQESFLQDTFRDGLILATLGTLVLVKKSPFIELVYAIIAVIIMVSGFNKLQDCVASWRLGIKNGLVYFLLASISIVIGLFIMMDYTIEVRPLHNLIGAGLLYSGITDLISTIFLSRQMNNYVNSLPKEEREAAEQVEEKEAE